MNTWTFAVAGTYLVIGLLAGIGWTIRDPDNAEEAPLVLFCWLPMLAVGLCLGIAYLIVSGTTWIARTVSEWVR